MLASEWNERDRQFYTYILMCVGKFKELEIILKVLHFKLKIIFIKIKKLSRPT